MSHEFYYNDFQTIVFLCISTQFNKKLKQVYVLQNKCKEIVQDKFATLKIKKDILSRKNIHINATNR